MYLSGDRMEINMKLIKTVVSSPEEEKIHMFVTDDNPLPEKIEELIDSQGLRLTGFSSEGVKPLLPAQVDCFISEEGKTVAITDSGRYYLKTRLYILEEALDRGFVKINKSAIANISKIERFEVSFQGGLNVVFKSGYVDYVSRRNIRVIKERFGF